MARHCRRRSGMIGFVACAIQRAANDRSAYRSRGSTTAHLPRLLRERATPH